MVTIKHQNGENEIYNKAGHQAHGSYAADLTGLNPKELLEASLGLCVSITFKKLLERDGITLEDDTLHIEVTALKSEDGANKFDNFHVKIDFPAGLDTEYKQKAMLIIERGCTIGTTLRNGASVNLMDTGEQ